MNGVIYTFYSYKGGVGRTMALANIGVQFYRQGYRTLLIDMDLEAPGLERYFEDNPDFDTSQISERDGFCDFIQAYLKRASKQPNDSDDLPYPSVGNYISDIGRNPKDGLMLMHAGRRSDQMWTKYAHFVQTFDWTDFYEHWEGGACLEWFADELRNWADVVLIDSRTGVTEMGGVATQHLADAVIVLFGSNLQNVDNSARMAAGFGSEAVRQARRGRELAVMAVPARVDDQDSRGFSEFQERYVNAFASIPGSVPTDGYSMDQMCIPYLAPFSYRESILFGNEELERSARRIIEAYNRIAANMQRMAARGTTLREGIPTSAKGLSNVALLAASNDTKLALELAVQLQRAGFKCLTLGTRSLPDSDLTQQLQEIRCAIAIVTSAFSESAVIRTLLQLVTDLAKPIIPAVFERVQRLPLLLVDKASVDCMGDLLTAKARLVEAIKAVRRPVFAIGSSTAFVSYSREDWEFADRMAKDLKAKGAKVWIDRLDIRPGQRWELEVESGLNDCSRMLVILSPASVGSTNVLAEAAFAIDEGKEVIPVLYQECRIPFRLRRLQYVDFRTSYDEGLQELLATLGSDRAAAETAAGTPAVTTTPAKALAQRERKAASGEKGQEELERRRIGADQTRLEEELE